MTLLTDVSGIGEEKADEAREAGYGTAEALALANLLNLCGETNLTPEDVLAAQRLLFDRYPNGWNTRRFAHQTPREAHCGYCEKQFDSIKSTPVKVHKRESCKQNPDSAVAKQREKLL